MANTFHISKSSIEMGKINFVMEYDPIRFNKVSRERHLDLNKLMRENVSESEKPEEIKV